jgi:hypothetical protein
VTSDEHHGSCPPLVPPWQVTLCCSLAWNVRVRRECFGMRGASIVTRYSQRQTGRWEGLKLTMADVNLLRHQSHRFP